MQPRYQKAYSSNGESFYVYASKQKGNVKEQLEYIGRSMKNAQRLLLFGAYGWRKWMFVLLPLLLPGLLSGAFPVLLTAPTELTHYTQPVLSIKEMDVTRN